MSRETKNILFSLFEDNFELPDQFNTDSLLVDTAFFDSLAIIQIIEIIHDNFGLEIKLKDIVLTDFDSIATLAKFVDSLKPTWSSTEITNNQQHSIPLPKVVSN